MSGRLRYWPRWRIGQQREDGDNRSHHEESGSVSKAERAEGAEAEWHGVLGNHFLDGQRAAKVMSDGVNPFVCRNAACMVQ